MESYAEMMQQEGGAEGMGALSEMMGGAPNAPMGGGGMGGGPPGALPEQEMQTMIDVLKEVRIIRNMSAELYPSLIGAILHLAINFSLSSLFKPYSHPFESLPPCLLRICIVPCPLCYRLVSGPASTSRGPRRSGARARQVLREHGHQLGPAD